MGRPPSIESNAVYNTDLPKFASKYIYLYYLKEDQRTECYFIKRRDRVSWPDMDGEIRDILEQIRSGEIRQNDSDPKRQEWKHRGYFVILFEDPEQTIEEGNPVTFHLEGSNENHSFRNGRYIELVDTNISGFFCLNHMWHKDGQTLGDGHVLEEGEKERFDVSVNHGVMVRGEYQRRNHELSGTNLGPPRP